MVERQALQEERQAGGEQRQEHDDTPGHRTHGGHVQHRLPRQSAPQAQREGHGNLGTGHGHSVKLGQRLLAEHERAGQRHRRP